LSPRHQRSQAPHRTTLTNPIPVDRKICSPAPQIPSESLNGRCRADTRSLLARHLTPSLPKCWSRFVKHRRSKNLDLLGVVNILLAQADRTRLLPCQSRVTDLMSNQRQLGRLRLMP